MFLFGFIHTLARILHTGKISPRVIFALFALSLEGEFKTEPIEFYVKDYVGKLKRGEFKAVYSIIKIKKNHMLKGILMGSRFVEKYSECSKVFCSIVKFTIVYYSKL